MSNTITKTEREAEPAFYSLGRCCELLKCEPDMVRSLAQSAQVRPALKLDQVNYYDANGFAAIYAEHQARQGS
ncbi:hypothetical protein [Aeoliella sp. SH292]|uniref:hypothetical protein n=1 Tax=Aeoliella sp. SH292 TaxID=3454464 RepID=UPI003F975F64